ncbi:MAG: DUF6789 family protein [Haloferacaceae archaeon]
MADSTTDAVAARRAQREEYSPITLRVVATAMVGGFVGMVLMLPLLVGVPVVFNLFRTEPIAQFAPFLAQIGVERSLWLGVALFVVGGTTVLPLMFVVVAAFLPPEEPRYLRGVTYATLFWTGFLLAFWPGGNGLTIAVFLVVSLLSHWIYGAVLGLVLTRSVGIPQHDV